MARRKVKLAFIVNNTSRKATYKKRKKGLLKKVKEISTLCGIPAGAIIYSPYDPNPEVWPSVADMHNLISEFRNVPKTEREKNMFDQNKFLKERIGKVDAHLKRQTKDNKEGVLTEVMYQCLLEKMRVSDIPSWDLNNLAYLLEQFLNIVNRRIEILGGSDMEIGEPSNDVAAATDPSETVGTLTFVEGAADTTVHGVASSSSSAAAGASFSNQMNHFPQHHQQFYQPSASDPFAAFYEQYCNQNRPGPEQMGYAASQMEYPFLDYTHPYHQAHHHHHHHQPPQQQQFFPGESSNAPPPATSGSDTPATTPNPTNPFWYRN